MTLKEAQEVLTHRGYNIKKPTLDDTDNLPEESGIFVVLGGKEGSVVVIGAPIAPSPWLRTDLQEYLSLPPVVAAKPLLVAYRVISQEEGEGPSGHLERLTVEQSTVVSELLGKGGVTKP